MSALSSLKVSDSLTASALTIPRRMRSWIRRSSDVGAAASASPFTGASLGGEPAGGAAPRRPAPAAPRAGRPLATVAPRDEEAEGHVRAPEAEPHDPVAPSRGRDQG